MERLKQYVLQNYEDSLALVTLALVFSINWYVPANKVVFLNLYFLPVIVAAYSLGFYHSILEAFLSISLVVLYYVFESESFRMPHTSEQLYLYIAVWGSFLIFVGALVGKQHGKLNQEIQKINYLNKQLQLHQEEVNRANLLLKRFNEQLEHKVRERTTEVEASKEAIEALKSKMEMTLHSTMDSRVAKLIIDERLRDEKRRISVLFSDLVNFTSYSEEHSPEIVVRDLNRYLRDMEPILIDYHAHIDKYMGDSMLSQFGAPLDYETYQLLAVLAGIKMQEKAATADYPWETRIGIATGAAIMGLIGSKRQHYTAIGDVVNLASRLQRACTPGGVLIDADTQEGVDQFIETRLKKELTQGDGNDLQIQTQLAELYEELQKAEEESVRAELHYETAQVLLSIDEFEEARSHIEHALDLQPENKYKVAFADVSLKIKKHQTMKIKGKKKRVVSFEVVGIRDPLLDRLKIPQGFYDKYRSVEEYIEFDENIILPTEALDGCIGHSKVVAIISYAIASQFEVIEQEKIDILNAAFVADIGKRTIPHHLLNRKGGLSTVEFVEIQKHPVESTAILEEMGYDSEERLRIVRHSHESFNGSGYPSQLAGEDIPLGARIVAVADSYDALTSQRPYRERWDRNATFDELRRSVGKGVFDPEVVESLIQVMS